MYHKSYIFIPELKPVLDGLQRSLQTLLHLQNAAATAIVATPVESAALAAFCRRTSSSRNPGGAASQPRVDPIAPRLLRRPPPPPGSFST
jgi:hypothetical protein